MKKRFLILSTISIIFTFNITIAQDITQYLKSAALKCNVKFEDPKFNNPHAGSGFLVKTSNGIYGCTAKHVLYFAKSDQMNSVDFKNTLKSWDFYSGIDKTKFVSSTSLMNEDSNEKLEGMFKNDWLIFKIDEKIPSQIKPLTLRKTKLLEGEKVYFAGYPYKKEGMVTIEGVFKNYKGDNSIVVSVPPAHYNGCSGGPVVDKNGLLIGIVSMGFYNEKTGVMTFEPATTDYFKKIINDYNN